MTQLVVGVMTVALLGAGCARAAEEPRSASGVEERGGATADIEAILERYVRAVNDADENALRDIWAERDGVSYVNPLQRLRSWEELEGFWQGFLRDGFTQRELRPENVSIYTSEDMAWAVFDWTFRATQADGTPYKARGWETQVYRRTEQGWRIGHVHYSVPMPPPAVPGP
jgi:ketosteroid isomerase-like protein